MLRRAVSCCALAWSLGGPAGSLVSTGGAVGEAAWVGAASWAGATTWGSASWAGAATWAGAAAWLGGCGAAPPTSVSREIDPDALVPDGYASLLRVRPRSLFADDATMRVVLAFVPTERLDAFRDRHGVDPREVEIASVATYERHSVVVARGPFHAAVVVSEIGHRMAPLESSAESPVLRRAGIYRMRRFELLALGAHDVALVDGPPALSGLLVHSRDVALRGEVADSSRLRSLVREEAEAPFLYVLHGRPELPPEGVGLLLARLEDTAVTLSPVGTSEPGALQLRVRLLGEFPPGAEANFRALVGSLAESDLGRGLGLEEVARSLVVEVREREVALGARVRVSTLTRGLRALFGDEIEEMLDDSP